MSAARWLEGGLQGCRSTSYRPDVWYVLIDSMGRKKRASRSELLVAVWWWSTGIENSLEQPVPFMDGKRSREQVALEVTVFPSFNAFAGQVAALSAIPMKCCQALPLAHPSSFIPRTNFTWAIESTGKRLVSSATVSDVVGIT